MKGVLMLKRSNDRKVGNSLTFAGNSRIANTFGLPAGKEMSCPGATVVCESICYAGKLEKLRPAVRTMLVSNFDQLKAENLWGKFDLLHTMLKEFEAECEKWKAPKLFRIHWDGDFYDKEYTEAWRMAILFHPEVKFWVYTRVIFALRILKDLPNLSLYFSGDRANLDLVESAKAMGVKIAMLGATFEDAKSLIGEKAAKCPEQRKQIALTGACVACNICIKGDVNMTFSISKRKGDM